MFRSPLLARMCDGRCYRVILLFSSPSSAEEFIDGGYEMMSGRRSRNLAAKDRLIGKVLTVVRLGIVGVLVHFVASKIDAGEQALAARVRQKFRVSKLGRRSLRVAAYGASGGGNISAKLYLSLEQILRALGAYANPDQTGRLAPSLHPEAAANQLDKGRRAPATGGAACGHSLSVLGANE